VKSEFTEAAEMLARAYPAIRETELVAKAMELAAQAARELCWEMQTQLTAATNNWRVAEKIKASAEVER
jgi:hypothetical protein